MKHIVTSDRHAFSPGLSFPRPDDHSCPRSEIRKETPTKDDNKDELDWQPYYFTPFDVDVAGPTQRS